MLRGCGRQESLACAWVTRFRAGALGGVRLAWAAPLAKRGIRGRRPIGGLGRGLGSSLENVYALLELRQLLLQGAQIGLHGWGRLRPVLSREGPWPPRGGAS